MKSTVEYMKQKIKSVIFKLRKQKTLNEKVKRIETNDTIRSLWDNFKHINIHITGVPGGKENKVLRTCLKKW